MDETYWKARWATACNRAGDSRDAYERDLARIIHSPAFRRLQGKTQVLGLGENDFYRTRLTHSIEVAQIAASLVRHHSRNPDAPEELKNVLPSASHITAISLFHDIGHPPFGHGGELALNRLMHDFGGFEGNAQTLRICTKLGRTYQQQGGLNLSRRTLLGVLKYPASRVKVCDSAFIEQARRRTRSAAGEDLSYVDINYKLWKPPKCFYDSEQDVVDWLLDGLRSDERDRFQEAITTQPREGLPNHKKTKHKSFDGSIMDLSDDISYGVHDLEDAIHLELVKRDDWEQFVNPAFDSLADRDIATYELAGLGGRLFDRRKKWETKNAIGQLVNYFICSSLLRTEEFSDPLLRYRVSLVGPPQAFLAAIKNLVVQKVIKSSNVQTLEFRGLQIVTRLFDALTRHPERLLGEETRVDYEIAGDASNRMRVVSDHVSGMTDDFATKLYERLFVPRRGFLFEKI